MICEPAIKPLNRLISTQCHPNRFERFTAIRFGPPESDPIALEVNDITGSLVDEWHCSRPPLRRKIALTPEIYEVVASVSAQYSPYSPVD